MALVGSLIVSKQLAGCRPDPGLGNNLSFVPCPGGWPLKKKLQTSIFLSTEVELQNDEMVFALIHLFFLFFYLFSYLSYCTSLSFSPPSAISSIIYHPHTPLHISTPLPLLPSSFSFFHVLLSHLKYSKSFLAVPGSLISSPVIVC